MNVLSKAGAALLVGLAACTDGGGSSIAAPDNVQALGYVASVSICCGGQFYKGTTTTMYATAYDQYGNAIQNPNIYWSSSDPSVASVGSFGFVEMVGVGYAHIWATVDGVSNSVLVQVVERPVVTTVTITPSPAKVQVGRSRQLTANAYDQNGSLMSGTTATWSIDNSSVASVSSSGSLQGVAVGSTTVRATISGVTGTASVTVEPYFYVEVDGPTAVFSAGTYQWTAMPTGGSGSYTYQWFVEQDGVKQALGTASTQTLWIDENTPGYTILTVQVTSGAQVEEGGTTVCNFISSMAC